MNMIPIEGLEARWLTALFLELKMSYAASEKMAIEYGRRYIK
jgi:hypothetical protein